MFWLWHWWCFWCWYSHGAQTYKHKHVCFPLPVNTVHTYTMSTGLKSLSGGVRGHTRRCFLPFFVGDFVFQYFACQGMQVFCVCLQSGRHQAWERSFICGWVFIHMHFLFMYKQRCEENSVKHTVDQSISKHCVNTFCKPCLLLDFISICLSISVWVFCLLVQSQKKNSLEKYSTQAKQKKVQNKIMHTAYTAGSIMCNRRFSIITGNKGKETFQIWKENLVLIPSLNLCFVFFRLDLVFLLQFYRLRYHLTRRFILFVTLLLSLTCLLLLLTCFMLFPDLLLFLLFLFRSFRSGFIAIL